MVFQNKLDLEKAETAVADAAQEVKDVAKYAAGTAKENISEAVETAKDAAKEVAATAEAKVEDRVYGLSEFCVGEIAPQWKADTVIVLLFPVYLPHSVQMTFEMPIGYELIQYPLVDSGYRSGIK